MTRRSVNEIETTLRKAAVGAGWPLGLAEDAGRSGAWLAATGADGVGLCVDALALPVPDTVSFDNQDGCLCVDTPTHALMLGPSIADVLWAGLENSDTVAINAASVTMPLLCIPPIASVAREKAVTCVASVDNIQIVCTPSGVLIDGVWPTFNAPAGITVACSGSCPEESSYKNVVSCYQQSLENGIDVDDTVWSRAVAFAAQTMVPASESSRQAGAGAGAIDNE